MIRGRARLFQAALAVTFLAGRGAGAYPAPAKSKPARAAAADDPLRHPGTFSLGPPVLRAGSAPPAGPGGIDLDIVVTGRRAAPRNEEVPLAPTGADRTGRDFAAPAADTQDVYGGTRSGGTYACRAGSICSATGGGGSRLRDLFGD